MSKFTVKPYIEQVLAEVSDADKLKLLNFINGKDAAGTGNVSYTLIRSASDFAELEAGVHAVDYRFSLVILWKGYFIKTTNFSCFITFKNGIDLWLASVYKVGEDNIVPMEKCTADNLRCLLKGGSGGSGEGMPNPMTAEGDLIVGGTSGTPTRLTIGSQGQLLKVGSSGIEWADETEPEPIPENLTKYYEVSNITNISGSVLDELKPGDLVIKITGNAKHAYEVSYKGEGAGQGICLTYCDASTVETVSYDRDGSGWAYNSTDVTSLTKDYADLGSALFTPVEGVTVNMQHSYKVGALIFVHLNINVGGLGISSTGVVKVGTLSKHAAHEHQFVMASHNSGSGTATDLAYLETSGDIKARFTGTTGGNGYHHDLCFFFAEEN